MRAQSYLRNCKQSDEKVVHAGREFPETRGGLEEESFRYELHPVKGKAVRVHATGRADLRVRDVEIANDLCNGVVVVGDCLRCRIFFMVEKESTGTARRSVEETILISRDCCA